MIVAVDSFSKWVEVGILRTRHSYEVAVWFHQNIMCRFGRPLVTRVDRGTEFAGVFREYLRQYGIVRRRISTMASKG